MNRNALKWGLRLAGLAGLAGVGVWVSRLVRARRRAELPDEPGGPVQD